MKAWAIRELIYEGIDSIGRRRNMAKTALDELHVIEQSLSESLEREARLISALDIFVVSLWGTVGGRLEQDVRNAKELIGCTNKAP